VTEHQPDLRHYRGVLRRQGWLIVLVTALALGAAAAVTFTEKPVYRASMKVVVGQGGGVFQPQFGGSVQPFARTMVNLFESNIVAQRTIDRLHLGMAPKQLLSSLNVSTTPDSSVLAVSYDSSNQARAVRILREMGAVFTALVKQKLGESRASGLAITASVFDPPYLEPGRVSPRPRRNLAFAGALGLAIGLVLAFLRDSLDNRIRSRRDAERWFGAPVLGALPKGMSGVIPAAADGRSKDGVALEALSMLRANLQFLEGGMRGPSIVVTSALPDEGKTTLVANLGVALTMAGNRVICVEADLRRPKLRQYLTIAPAEHGVIDVVEKRIELDRALIDVPVAASSNGGVGSAGGSMKVLLAGRAQSNPADVLTAERVEQLVDQLRARADYVIFDAPPILLVGDALPLVHASDNVIVVAREGRTTREMADAVRVTLERLGVERIGVVLTDWQASGGYTYGYPAEATGS
jgi:capsular exopolysaccharide synthesis family protein